LSIKIFTLNKIFEVKLLIFSKKLLCKTTFFIHRLDLDSRKVCQKEKNKVWVVIEKNKIHDVISK
jgi:hypothetical protein